MKKYDLDARQTVEKHLMEMRDAYLFDYKQLLLCESEINDVFLKLKHPTKYRRDIVA